MESAGTLPVPTAAPAAVDPLTTAGALPVPSSAPAAVDPLTSDLPMGPHLPPGGLDSAGANASAHERTGLKVPVTPVGALLANAKRAAETQADGVPKRGVGAAAQEEVIADSA